MNLLILDTETSGLMDDPKARLIEVAVALYSVEERSIIATHSHLEPLPAGELNGAYSANKITDGLLDRATQLRWGTWDQVYNLAIEAEAVVAHDRDGTFDRHFVRKAIGDHLAWQRISEGLPWINSLDIQYEQSEVGGRRSLDFLACRHEIGPLGPWRPRAGGSGHRGPVEPGRGHGKQRPLTGRGVLLAVPKPPRATQSVARPLRGQRG